MSGRRGMVWRLALLVTLVAVAVPLVLRSVGKLRRGRLADSVCGAAAERRWPEVLKLSQGLAGTEPAAQRIAECRSVALLETSRRSEAVAVLERQLQLSGTTGDWLPLPPLAAVLIEERRDRGDLQGASELAYRAAQLYPHEFVLRYLDLDLRSRLEEESSVLAEARSTLASAGTAEPKLRLELAQRHCRREEWQAALDVLGESPPAAAELRSAWYRLQAQAAAGQGDGETVRAAFGAWQSEGGDPLELRASYALLLSQFGLTDPRLSTEAMLRQLYEVRRRLEDPELRHGVLRRLLGTLVVEGRHGEALALYDEAVTEGADLGGITREDLERSRSRRLLEGDRSTARGVVRFELRRATPGERLLLSGDEDLPPDTDYEEQPFPGSGIVEVERRIGFAPLRWVLVGPDARATASGTVWPLEQRTVEVRIERRPSAPGAAGPPPPAVADGRRRVFVIVLDCGDWRLIRYLDHRGELPTVRHFLATGHSAVLESDPPYTAVAIQALARPQQRGVSSFFGLVHQLGVEISGLNFIGANPFGGLSWVLPPADDLFATLGRTDLVTANLLRSYGGLQVGRQAQLVGPRGAERLVAGYRGSRPLADDEIARVPGLGSPPREHDGLLIEEMAADFDTAEQIVEQGEVDLLLLRVASLDLLTHGLFPASVRSGQDDGAGFLYDTYRYIDLRLGELASRIDGDDLLVVLSDHGIRTGFEHDVHCFFVAVGGGVRPGRTEERPSIRGVGRMLSDLVGVETDWPATGIEAWVADVGQGTG